MDDIWGNASAKTKEIMRIKIFGVQRHPPMLQGYSSDEIELAELIPPRHSISGDLVLENAPVGRLGVFIVIYLAYGGFQSHGRSPIAGWVKVMENPNRKNGMI